MLRFRPLLRTISPAHRLYARSATRAYASEVSPGSGLQADLSGLGPKRFYDEVNIAPQPNGSFAVTVDGKVVRTPLRSALTAPTSALATAVAAEWDAQVGRLRPASMPLTTLVSTALDVIPNTRDRIFAAALNFLDTDTVCIRPDYPSELVEAQNKVFAPVLAHLEKERHAKLNIARGSLSAPQTDQVRDTFSRIVRELDNYSLAAMDLAAASSKSIAVAIALRDGAVSAQQALEAARSEERWQMGVWGEVEGGHDLDEADALVRLSAANAVFRFVDMEPEAFLKATSDTKK